jgi:TolA-binding protein
MVARRLSSLIPALLIPALLPAAAQTVAPARPVEEPLPPAVAPETPVAPARPVAEPAADPAPGFLQPDPAADLLAFADMLASQGDHAAALVRYEQFFRENPNHEQARKALYFAAECLRKLDREGDAQNTYALLVDRFKNGQYVDSAAYRAAALAYNRRDFRQALPYFQVARSQTLDPAIKLDATFRAARCLQQLGRSADATPLLREIVATPPPNAFREPAQLALARGALEANRKEEALPLFLDITRSATDPAVRGEALVRAGLIEADLGRIDEARSLLNQVFALDGADAWKPVAQFGLIQNRYQAKDFEGVIDAYNKGVFQLADDMRAQMFLMTGNAYQRLGRFDDAIKVYGILENFFQGQPEADEAGYRRLQCLYQKEDPNLPGFVDHYVTTQKDSGRRSPFVDRALLLKAEFAFAARDSAAAADAYGAIRIDNLPEAMRAGVMYKTAWAQGEAGQRQQAVDSFGRFLTRHPKDERAPVALARRAELHQQNGDDVRALQDYQMVIDRYPEAPGTEFAYQQAALIHGNANDTAGMMRLYQGLLDKFPETRAAPEAHYALGRGYYRSKEYSKALHHLRLARDADPKLYGRPAGSRIVLACYALKDAAALRVELEEFLKEGKIGELPVQVPAWLGVKLYEEGKAAEAADFLGMSANREDPKATEPVIWKYFGKALLDAGRFGEAVTALDHYLDSAKQPEARANGMLDKARAQFALRAHAEADATAADGQKAVRQGKTNAWLSILRGDIAYAQDQFAEAAKHYVVVSQFLEDPEITPLALWKLSLALQRDGKRAEARQFRTELQQRYPN